MKITSLRNTLWQQQTNTLSLTNFAEIVFLTMVPLCGGFLFNREDPFLLQFRFPFLMIAPLLVALRYGSMHGMISFSLTLVLVTAASLNRFGNIEDYPGELLFGTLVLTLLAGEMTRHLRGKIYRIQAEKEILTMRFGEFINTYHVMKVSHDQLKEKLANANFSLREALQVVRDKMREQYRDGNHGLNLEVGNALLSVFNYFCSTRIAGVYLVDSNGEVTGQPVAVQGNMDEFRNDDHLIRRVLEEGTMVSILPEMHTRKKKEELQTDLLVAVPIKDAADHLWGVVGIVEMDFHGFQEENLNLMQLIGSYTGDLLSRAENLFYAENDRQAFISELKNFWCLAREYGITSSIICITFNTGIPTNEFLTAILNRFRGLDHCWLHGDEKKNVVISLMPLMGETEYLNFCQSINKYLRDCFGHTVEEVGGVFHREELRGDRRFFDYVSFISDRMNNNADSPLPVSDQTSTREATPATITVSEEDMGKIGLLIAYEHAQQIAVTPTTAGNEK